MCKKVLAFFKSLLYTIATQLSVFLYQTRQAVFLIGGKTVKKPVFYTEAAFLLGLFFLAWGTALTVWGNWGISMVVAPAYILHLAISKSWGWFSFGVAEYVLQAVVLCIMMLLLRKIRIVYFWSFATAVIYGILLDLGTFVIQKFLPTSPSDDFRFVMYILGDCAVCTGVALMFKTYFQPEVYEMFIKEVGKRSGVRLYILKTIYDCCSLVVAVCMSYILLGQLEGIGIGTVVCALVNGTMIKVITILLDRFWVFGDLLPYRTKFEESEETV